MTYEKFQALGASLAPRPFPGEYPTRITISSSRGPVPFFYAGKPVPSLKALLRRKYFRQGGQLGSLETCEFDQNGILRQLRGGSLMATASFSDMYFPLHPFWHTHLGNWEKLWLFLDRETKSIKGRNIYVNTVWKDTKWEELIASVVRDLSRARFGRDSTSETEAMEMTTFLAEKVRTEWRETVIPPMPIETPPTRTRPPRPVRTAGLDAATFPTPLTTRPWDIEEPTLQQMAATAEQIQNAYLRQMANAAMPRNTGAGQTRTI